jgi:methylmalonyl-CoA mutase C-terminal domain/subunit
MTLLKEQHRENMLVVLGGIIPEADVAEMKALGIAEVFPPGASLEQIVQFIRTHVRKAA